ncbi:MAG: hypothetical protein R3A78_12995 [Polyangiales bacterium]|nr:hypothetical protein [Myxococcales bacterium]
MEQRKLNFKVVYTIVERPNGKEHWLRIGNAFVNRDGSTNLYLDAMPLNGKLQVRDYVPFEDRGKESASDDVLAEDAAE